MQLTNSPARYGAIPQLFHWLTALCVVAGWLLGWFMFVWPRGTAGRSYALLIHMSLGQCVIVLLVARLAWRIADPPPPMERTRFGRLLAVAAKASHYTLYALLVATPLIGVVFQLKRSGVLPVFGVWELHAPWPVDREQARSIFMAHKYLANALLILAGVHALAALTHHWIFGDRTLTRMLPGSGAGEAGEKRVLAVAPPLSP
jgi:cytochrome b561